MPAATEIAQSAQIRWFDEWHRSCMIMPRRIWGAGIGLTPDSTNRVAFGVVAAQSRVIREVRRSMARPTELPQLVAEFVDMSKEYLRQETLEPAKRLGRFAGFTIGAALLFAVGGVLLSIAAMRGIIYLLPEGPNWSALGYILGALSIAAVIGVMVGITSSGSETKEEV